MSDLQHYLILFIPLCVGILSLGFAYFRYSRLQKLQLKHGQVYELTQYFREGAQFFLKRQLRIVLQFFVLAFLVMIFYETFTNGRYLLSIFLLVGGVVSAYSGYVSMYVTTQSVSALFYASREGLFKGLKTGINLGAISAFCVTGFVLLDLSLWYVLLDFLYSFNLFGISNHLLGQFGIETFTSELSRTSHFIAAENLDIFIILLAYCSGAALQAVFSRIGGGIFAKSADISGDLAGLTEYDLPEDDLRNPAVVADQVGDHVANVAGLGSDFYGTIGFSIVLTAALGSILTTLEPGWHPFYHAVVPFLVFSAGTGASFLVTLLLKPRQQVSVKWGFYHLMSKHAVSLIMTALLCYGLVYLNWLSLSFLYCLYIGLLAAFFIHWATILQGSVAGRTVDRMIQTAHFGVLSVLLRGLVSGFLGAIFPIIVVISAIVGCFVVTHGAISFMHGVYGLGLATVAFLSQSAFTLSYAFMGPISDNVKGISMMMNETHDVQQAAQRLDAFGNISVSYSKIQSLVAMMMVGMIFVFGFIESVYVWIHRFVSEHGLYLIGPLGFTSNKSLAEDNPSIHFIDHLDLYDLIYVFDLHVLNLELLGGLLLGVLLIIGVTGVLLKGVDCGQKLMTDEIREQIQSQPEILEGQVLPNYQRLIQKGMRFSLKWMVWPVLMVIVAPILSAIGLGVAGVTGLLLGSITTAGVLGICLIYSGLVWDNAKTKLSFDRSSIGTAPYVSVMVGDQLGDAFKDAVAPAYSVLIKLLGAVSLLVCYLALIFEKWVM